MSWMSQLYETYDCVVNSEQHSEVKLTPVAHMNANAQLEVTLSMAGDFVRAVTVDKKGTDAVTLIPVTEASAGRSSGVAPHGLCDTLSYVAGDFAEHCEAEKQKKTSASKYESYMRNLKSWTESEWSHPKAEAVYRYLSKRCLISDLVNAGLVGLDENEIFDGKKISGQPYEKALVRFRVLSENVGMDGTWQDPSLVKAYTEYYLSGQKGKADICYLVGEKRVISENHPKGIVASDYGAKLVSANDNQGYTYRGRFADSEQAYALSYEASQKIHSALTWLVKNQGVYVGSNDKRMFLCWNPDGKETPDLMDPFGMWDSEAKNVVEVSYWRQLWKALQGYQEQFKEEDRVMVMGLDAATTGRLSITYYQELMASDFFRRLLNWGKTCNWFYLNFNEQKKPIYERRTPTFRQIVQCAYGRESTRFLEVDDKVLKDQTQRLVKCMLEGQKIPRDLVQMLTIRASTPLAYTNLNRERILSTACAVIKKYYEREYLKKGEDEEMKLNPENRDRSYLFGRLLAVYEKIERSTYDAKEGREPNAIRLQSAYVNHPMQTWKILEDLMNPYFCKLPVGLREYYRRMISEITDTFDEKDMEHMNQGLKETYLLGYYLQRAELNRKKEETKNEQSAE